MNNEFEYNNEEYQQNNYEYSVNDEHLLPNHQALKGTKKKFVIATSGILAGVIALTGFAISKRNKNKNVEIEPITILTTEETTEPEMDYGNLILYEDFDIDNIDAVRKRASDIYEISEKKYSVDEIINMIYYFNGKAENIKFKNGASKEDKFKYLQNLAIHFADLVSNNIKDDLNRLYSLLDKDNKEDDVLSEEDNEIYAYMFMPGDKKIVVTSTTDEEVEIKTNKKRTKDYAIALALEVDAQLDAIKNGSVSEFEKNAQNFYKIVEEINKLENASDGDMVMMIYDYKKKTPLYHDYLTKEQQDVISNTTQNNYLNSLFFDASKKTGAEYDANKGNKVTTTPVTEKVVATDKADANKRETTTRKFEKPIIIDQGGKKVTTSKQTITTPGTTKIETFTFVVPTTKPSETYTTEIIHGGEVVSESYVDKDAEDAKRFEEEVTQLNPENTTTTKYVDADDVIVLDEGGKHLN